MKNKYFLRWWLLAVLLMVGATLLYVYHIFTLIANYDVTKISYLIFTLFIIFSVKAGIKTYKPVKECYRDIKVLDFFADAFFKFGMIGTVIGFIYMLHTCFVGLSVTNTATLQAALISMSTGMSTALFTTAAGLICGFLLKLQIFNLQQAIEAAQ